MSPEEIIKELAVLDITITRRTLLNYEKWDLIPKATRGGGGAGGRWADYPSNETLEQAYAAWCLIHGEYGDERLRAIFADKLPKVTPEAIALIRAKAIEFEYDFNADCFGEEEGQSGALLSAFYQIWILLVTDIRLKNQFQMPL